MAGSEINVRGMSATARATLVSEVQPARLTKAETVCMEAYYALLPHWAAHEIGSAEIRQWIRVAKDIRAPSNTVVLTALRKTRVAHRRAGRPFGSRARLDHVGSPFLPSGPSQRYSRSAR